MNTYLLCSVLLLLVIFPFFAEGLTGRTCTRKKSRSETYTAYQQKRIAQKYHTKCGFGGWKRCTRYRNVYEKEAVQRTRPKYFAEVYCCPGWRVDKSGSNCAIHDKFPTVVFCPKELHFVATAKLTDFRWQAPKFKEPFDYPLNIKSTFGADSAKLPWGLTTVKYTATSSNNNKEVSCSFVISVLPPVPKAAISGVTSGSTVDVDEHQKIVLECYAHYGKPPPTLKWYREGVEVTKGAVYRQTKSDYEDYKHAINTLTLNPTRADANVTYECRASPDVSKASVKLHVKYEVKPEVVSCPSNITRDSSERQTLVKWDTPIFKDVRYGDDVDVVGSLGNITQKEFGWGKHRVRYVGTNRRNKLSSVCEFVIRVKPPGCDEDELKSDNSSSVLACAFWPNTHSHICQPFCPRDYDVNWFGVYPQLYICDTSGEWWPKPKPLDCKVPRYNLASHHLPSPDQYYDGVCREFRPDLAAHLLKAVKKSPFRNLCQGLLCNNSVMLSVDC